MRIQKKEDGTLLVPLRAEAPDGTIGDATIEIKKDHRDYQKYLKMYEDEQKRLNA
jgi:hypothetical protein